MSVITYRSFKRSDAKQIHKVTMVAWKLTYKHIFDVEYIEKFVNYAYEIERLKACFNDIESGKTFFQVVLDNDRIIGFCQISVRGIEAILNRIYILPNYLKKGIGFNLLQLVENYLTKNKILSYYWYVHKDNALGVNFYKRQYLVHKKEKDKIDENEWFMEKILIDNYIA